MCHLLHPKRLGCNRGFTYTNNPYSVAIYGLAYSNRSDMVAIEWWNYSYQIHQVAIVWPTFSNQSCRVAIVRSTYSNDNNVYFNVHGVWQYSCLQRLFSLLIYLLPCFGCVATSISSNKGCVAIGFITTNMNVTKDVTCHASMRCNINFFATKKVTSWLKLAVTLVVSTKFYVFFIAITLIATKSGILQHI